MKLTGTFNQFKPFQALVLGDFMLDTYTTGRVKRISPEAPVPVMEVMKQESRPGGAGNVVLNLASLGATVFAVGRIGEDAAGKELKSHFHEMNTTGLFIEPHYKTPVKNRLIAESQQLLRIDFETISPLPIDLEDRILLYLKESIPQMQVIAFSDYGKGFLTHRLIQSVLDMARRANVPTVVDPKGIDFAKYKGASVLKPNLLEAYQAAKCPPHFSLDQVAKELLLYAETLLITRSEAGISIFNQQNERFDFPVRSKEVKDVTGAGDTVLAIICLGLANGLDIRLAAQLANIAAGLAIERVGCVQITLAELAGRLLEIDSDTKIFDESHTFALSQVLKGKQFSLLVLEKGQTMTNSLFRTIRELSSTDNELLIYMRDCEPNDELIHILSSLHEVDSIILQTESLKNLCEAIHPQEIYKLENDQAIRLFEAKNLLEGLVYRSATT